MNVLSPMKRIPTAGDADGDAMVGKDLLELVSTAMYVEPLTAYREYVQNAADGIDAARAAGLLDVGEAGRVEVAIDPGTRTIRIRDNGVGIAGPDFGSRMRALGGSTKRGTRARGFRGVGRLVGLAYAQRLVFRSRSSADEPVQELVWDCRALRQGLKTPEQLPLADFVREITSLGQVSGEFPDRFFEVELGGVVRQGDDRLLRPETVGDYLSQVAPVPFSPEFALAADIREMLDVHPVSSDLEISVNGGEPLVRPHRDRTPAGVRAPIGLGELTTFEVPGLDGGTAAVGWIAHHAYDGAIPAAALVKGLRARVGGIQIGGSSLFEDVFPEPRFSSWTVGEVHVLDPRILPNGRRDQFEQNGHYANLLNHLSPVARDIARRCRTSSADRQKRRAFELQSASAEEQLDVMEQGALGDEALVDLSRSLAKTIAVIEKTAGDADLLDADREGRRARAVALRARFDDLSGGDQPPSPLERLPDEKRVVYQEVIDLVYECSANRLAAKALVDRMLERLDSRTG